MTRLLKTCIAGCSAALVDSSRIDMLAGLSKCESLRTPPLFCAPAGEAAAISSPPAASKPRTDPDITVALPCIPRPEANCGARRALGRVFRGGDEYHGSNTKRYPE